MIKIKTMSNLGIESSQNNVQDQVFSKIQINKQQHNIDIKSEQLPQPPSHPDKHYNQLITLLVSFKLSEMGFDSEKYLRYITQRSNQSRDIKPVQVSIVVQQILFDIINSKKIQRPYSNSVHQQVNEPPSEIIMFQNTINRKQSLCLICFIETNDYFKNQCNHAFCKECLRNVIIEDMENARYQIICPAQECTEKIPQPLIQKLLADKYPRLVHFRDKFQLESNPNNKFCSKADCGGLLYERQNQLYCRVCSSQYCQVCIQKYHQGECDMAIRQSLQHTYDKYRIKKCPNCKTPIQKNDGCNQMTCKKCKYDFCWVCLKKYTIHHFRYYNCFGCPGMQFQNEDDLCKERLKQVFFFLMLPLLLVLFIVLFFLLLPVFMVVSFFSKTCEWSQRSMSSRCQNSIVNGLCQCLPECIKVIILYILLIPRGLLYMVFFAPIRFFLSISVDFLGLFH